MFVPRECCVFSGRGFCVGWITRPEESYRLRCLNECDREGGGHNQEKGRSGRKY
jgi:hypothetical protein